MEKEISERPWPCIVFFGISTCVIYSPKPVVAASLAVLLAVVHLPALEVVEQLARPATPKTIKFPAIYGGHNHSCSQSRRRYQIIISNIIYK